MAAAREENTNIGGSRGMIARNIEAPFCSRIRRVGGSDTDAVWVVDIHQAWNGSSLLSGAKRFSDAGEGMSWPRSGEHQASAGC
jgi:hypothetical protein